MPRRIDAFIAPVSSGFQDGGSQYVIEANNGDWYVVYIDNGSDVVFRKSTDHGQSWKAATVVYAGTVTQLSVWFDRWSNIAAGLIHCAYSESVNDDTLYRTINTESADALSTQTTIFAGVSTAAGGHLSITRARGGNVYCKTCIDAGAEGGFYRLPNANVPDGAWDAARTINEANATLDQIALVPGFAADNQDIMAIFYDNSATELSRQVYDDSANSWAETSIDTDCTFPAVTTAYPHFAVAVDLTNSQLIVVMWNATDTASADLRCWTVTEGAITAKTDVVANGTDDQGLCAVGIDTVTGYWYVFYVGKSDGSETLYTAVNVYYKVSQDSGSTWGPETVLTNNWPSRGFDLNFLFCTPRFAGLPFGVIFGDGGINNSMAVSIDIQQPRVTSAVGI